jgi:hypothetical protein
MIKEGTKGREIDQWEARIHGGRKGTDRRYGRNRSHITHFSQGTLTWRMPVILDHPKRHAQGGGCVYRPHNLQLKKRGKYEADK